MRDVIRPEDLGLRIVVADVERLNPRARDMFVLLDRRLRCGFARHAETLSLSAAGVQVAVRQALLNSSAVTTGRDSDGKKLLGSFYHLHDLDLRFADRVEPSLQHADWIFEELRRRGAPERCYVMSASTPGPAGLLRRRGAQ